MRVCNGVGWSCTGDRQVPRRPPLPRRSALHCRSAPIVFTFPVLTTAVHRLLLRLRRLQPAPRRRGARPPCPPRPRTSWRTHRRQLRSSPQLLLRYEARASHLAWLSARDQWSCLLPAHRVRHVSTTRRVVRVPSNAQFVERKSTNPGKSRFSCDPWRCTLYKGWGAILLPSQVLSSLSLSLAGKLLV